MLLELLQHVLRIEPRVGIIEPGDKAERDDVIFAAINPRPAVFVRGQRPAHGVNHFARRDASGGHLPEFLHAHAVGLRIAITVEIEALDELLGQRAARALGQDHDLGIQVVAGLEVGFRLVLLCPRLCRRCGRR